MDARLRTTFSFKSIPSETVQGARKMIGEMKLLYPELLPRVALWAL
jgi:hypothetical protein